MSSTIRSLSIFVLALAVGWLGHRLLVVGAPRGATRPAVATDSLQIALIFVGKESCAWSNRPEVRSLLHAARAALQERADVFGARVWLVGIGVDQSAERSMRYLERIGDFDQVVAGRVGSGNANDEVPYLSELAAGSLATPQVLVVVHRRAASPGAANAASGRGELVMRQVGLFEFRRWVATGSRASFVRAQTVIPSLTHH